MQKAKGTARRRPVAKSLIEASQPEAIFFPYSQCMCDLANSIYNPYVQSNDDLVDLDNYYSGAPLPPERLIPLNHDNGVTSDHLPECPQLHIVYSKTSKKASRHGRQASYPDSEEEKENFKAHIRKENARRQRKKTRRNQDAEAKAEARIAVKLASKPLAQCHCHEALSDSEENAVREEARTVGHTHTDGTTTFHLPDCVKRRSDHTTTRNIYTSPAKPVPSLSREEKEIAKARKKADPTGRKPPKSAAYIFSDGEEEGQGAEVASPAAKRYDPRTIASDILRAIGHHPYLPPLNAHVEGYPTKKKGRAAK